MGRLPNAKINCSEMALTAPLEDQLASDTLAFVALKPDDIFWDCLRKFLMSIFESFHTA